MLSYPGRGTQVPLQGIATMDEPSTRLSRVIEGAAELGARLAEQQETVSAAGSLAEFAGRLRAIEQEARDEIDMQNVRDWKYAWNQASEARIAAAVDELPPESRAAGRQLASVYNAQASATARRDYELGRIGLARHRWQARVNDAVERGDAAEAERWLRAGETLFVPKSQLDERVQRAKSKSVLNRWKEAFRDDPQQALENLLKEGMLLPEEAEDLEELQRIRDDGFREVSRQMADEMDSAVERGLMPARSLFRKAEAIGALSAQQVAAAAQSAYGNIVRPSGEWNLSVDECPAEQDAETRLKLDIISSSVPIAEKRTLLQRLRDNREIPVARRSHVARRLWNMYRNGCFGCPEDTEARSQLTRLQARLPQMMKSRTDRELELWLESVQPQKETWICYQQK